MIIPIFRQVCVNAFDILGVNLGQKSVLLNATLHQRRNISVSSIRNQSEEQEAEEDQPEEDPKGSKKFPIDPLKDRSKKIPLEVSLKYMESKAYQDAYGGNLIWKLYRRNHKYGFPPRRIRKTCIRSNVISAGNPCPICRDEYLVIDYRNLKLLNQFISPYTDEIIPAFYTGVCRTRHFQLEVAITKARDYGYIPFHVPHREYNYEEYYPQQNTDKDSK